MIDEITNKNLAVKSYAKTVTKCGRELVKEEIFFLADKFSKVRR